MALNERIIGGVLLGIGINLLTNLIPIKNMIVAIAITIFGVLLIIKK